MDPIVAVASEAEARENRVSNPQPGLRPRFVTVDGKVRYPLAHFDLPGGSFGSYLEVVFKAPEKGLKAGVTVGFHY